MKNFKNKLEILKLNFKFYINVKNKAEYQIIFHYKKKIYFFILFDKF